jgi:hypothetical protein
MFERKLPNVLSTLKLRPIFGPIAGAIRTCAPVLTRSKGVLESECLYSSAEVGTTGAKHGMHSFPCYHTKVVSAPLQFDACPGSEARVGLLLKLQVSFQGRLRACLSGFPARLQQWERHPQIFQHSKNMVQLKCLSSALGRWIADLWEIARFPSRTGFL